MKYNNREVQEFTIDVNLGNAHKANNIKEFRRNQNYTISTLCKNKVKHIMCAEAVYDDYVIISTDVLNIEDINNLYLLIKPLFEKVTIGIYYEDYDEFDFNAENFEECLDVNLFSK